MRRTRKTLHDEQTPYGLYRQCTLCLVSMPATTEYFREAKVCRMGLSHTCRICARELGRERYRRLYGSRKSLLEPLNKQPNLELIWVRPEPNPQMPACARISQYTQGVPLPSAAQTIGR